MHAFAFQIEFHKATMNRAATAGALLALFTGIVSAQDGGYFGIGAGRSTYDTQINANRAVERTYDEIPLAPLDPGGSISEAARDSDGSNKDDFGKVGATYYRNKSLHRWAVSANQTTDAGLVQYEDGRSNSSNDSGVSWLFGLGAAIHFWDRYAVNLEYESF